MLKKARDMFWGGVEKAKDFVCSTAGKVAGAVAGGVVAVEVFAVETVMAADSITIPDMPIDWADVGSKAAVVLGAVIAGLIGLKIVMSLINAGIRFLSRMLS